MGWKPKDEKQFWLDRANNLSRIELCQKYNATLGQLKHYVANNPEHAVMNKNSAVSNEERVETKDSLSISLKQTPIHTLEQLVEYAQIDLSVWEVERFIVNKWEGFAKMPSSELGKEELVVQPLFQVKVFLKKKKEAVTLKALYEELKSDLLNYAPDNMTVSRLPRKFPKTEPKLLELSIADHHLGKLCWGEEVGTDYDLKIAIETYWNAVNDLLQKAQGFDFDKILFVVGHDFLNSDNLENQTTRGTAQDTDTRFFKLYREARSLLCEVIDRLREFAPVDVLVVSGNHDYQAMFCLGDALSMYYHHADDVNIINTPRKRKYYEYGNVMLLLTHGNDEKIADLPLVMAQEEPQMWGRTKYREVHIGHFHSKKVYSRVDVNENHGVRTRILPSLTATDFWHYTKGYVGNIRSSEAFIWDKEKGLEATLVHNI